MLRSESKIQELFRPKRVVIGNFDYLSASAFAGCHVCRILFRHVVQKATSIQDLYGLYKIVRISLSLSLDDELALFCEDDAGPLLLCDLQADVVSLHDGDTIDDEVSEDHGADTSETSQRDRVQSTLSLSEYGSP
jgi:hypothetical protein